MTILFGSGDSAFTASVVLLGGGVTCILVTWMAFWRETAFERKEASRFGMFAARDRLVCLVAEGTMSQDEHAWTWTYNSVNNLLRMHQRLHLLGVVLTCARYLATIRRDPAEQRRCRDREDHLQKVARDIPEFAAVQAEINKAFVVMVMARTTLINRAILKVIMLAISTVAAFEAGWSIYRSLRRPKAGEIVGFGFCKA